MNERTIWVVAGKTGVIRKKYGWFLTADTCQTICDRLTRVNPTQVYKPIPLLSHYDFLEEDE